jgi:hypothetical protein
MKWLKWRHDVSISQAGILRLRTSVKDVAHRVLHIRPAFASDATRGLAMAGKSIRCHLLFRFFLPNKPPTALWLLSSPEIEYEQK